MTRTTKYMNFLNQQVSPNLQETHLWNFLVGFHQFGVDIRKTIQLSLPSERLPHRLPDRFPMPQTRKSNYSKICRDDHPTPQYGSCAQEDGRIFLVSLLHELDVRIHNLSHVIRHTDVAVCKEGVDGEMSSPPCVGEEYWDDYTDSPD